jgi:DNA-binding IclR family transcriptional regulator
MTKLGPLEKAFKIVDLRGETPGGLRLMELSDALGFPESTIHHILQTLRGWDFVDQDQDTKRYVLGFKFISISSKILSGIDIRRTAYNHLRQLHQQINETVNLTILRNGKVTFIDKIQRIGGLSLDTYPGFSTDPHAAASGKVLLAGLAPHQIQSIYKTKPLRTYGKNTITRMSLLLEELENIRRQGYALDNEEYYEGVRCVAAPIISRGRMVAAVSATGSVFTMTMDRIESELIAAVQKTAEKISLEMPG